MTTENPLQDSNQSAPAERRQMTFRENLMLTIKVLTGFGVLGAALWGVEMLISAR